MRLGNAGSRCASCAPTPRVVGSTEPSSETGGFGVTVRAVAGRARRHRDVHDTVDVGRRAGRGWQVVHELVESATRDQRA